MGWLKRLFRKKKTLAQVQEWLGEQKEQNNKDLDEAVKTLEHELPPLITEAKEKLRSIERAELENPNIPERAKNFMTGNREQYLRLSQRFIENLFVPKESADFSQLDLQFHEYSKNSSRPASILSEFFGEQVKQLKKVLAEIESKIAEAKKQDAKNEQITHIEKLIEQLKQIELEQEQTRSEKEKLILKLEHINNKLESIKKEKEELTKNPDYMNIKNEIVNAARARQEAQEAITELFSPLAEPIKKFAYKKKNEKLAKYAENPLDELIQDYSLAILKYVDELIAAITKEEIEIKPERKQKALDSLKQFNKDHISRLIHNYANSKKRETDVHNEIMQKPIMKEYEQYAREIKNTNNDIEQLEQTINKIKLPSNEHVYGQLMGELEKHNITLVE